MEFNFMEQITILVENKEKVSLLSALLKALDFVKSVRVDTIETDAEKISERDSGSDFFSLSGIWKDRDIELTTIRAQVWPRQS